MSRPAIFADLEFDAALAKTAAEKKLLLVDATASWCGPCNTMDRTTWIDAAVIDALREKALAIQIDVDEKSDVAKKLNIMAMPTVIAFRDGVELDRVVGLQRREQLLEWLDGLARGETTLDRQRAASAAKPNDMQARMSLAKSLFAAGKLDEAAKEFVWLWEHVLEHEPAMVGVRHSYLVGDLERVSALHPPTREALVRLRDAAAPESGATLDAKPLADWFSLNHALGENARVVAWFDASHPRANGDKKLAWLLESHLVPLLLEANRWADAGTLFEAPLATLESTAELKQHMKGLPPEVADQFREYATEKLRTDAAMLVRALRAANRDDDAKAVAAEARKLDDSAEMSAALRGAESA